MSEKLNECPESLDLALRAAMDDLLRNQLMSPPGSVLKGQYKGGWLIEQCYPEKPGDGYLVRGKTWDGTEWTRTVEWKEACIFAEQIKIANAQQQGEK